jgi:hypothetical protein
MRELIKHILKENDLKQELKKVIEDDNIFKAADLVGGMDNLKSIFKDVPEMSSLFDKLTGTIIFYYTYVDGGHMKFPLEYEIIGRHSNNYNTNYWPEINVIYDENKLTPEENDTFKSIIKYLYDEAQHSAFKSKFENSKLFNTNYFTVKELNGENIDLFGGWDDFSNREVDEIHDKLYGESESLNESEKDTKRLFKIIKMIMEDMILPEYGHIICSYEITLNEDFFNIPQVVVTLIGGYGTKLWPVTQAIRQMYLDVLDKISKEIENYTGVVIYVDMLQTPKCEDKENIYLRESESEDKDYSPAGKEITPNQIVVHKSNPMFRDKIMENGLKVRAGECYKVYVGYGVKCKPAIFATNSTNKRAWFDSTYDDDIWFIDTTMIPDVKWFKDRHFESRSKHIVTFQDIPKEAITLKYEGTGSSEDVLNSWPEDSPNRLQESIRSILREDSLKNDLMESESKSEDKKLDLVKQMILQLFDEVEYIEIDEIYGKPLIKIYHDVEDTAVNYDNWFEEVIEDKIDEMTGGNIILCSWWTPQWHYKRKNADFFIDVEKIEYDDDGNKINESEEKQPKYLDIIKDIVEPFKNEDCVCDIKVSYDEDDMYLIDVEVGLFELREKFYAEVGRNHYVKKIRVDIKEAIKGYIPIDNYYVGSHATPKCGEKRWWDKNINESDNKEQSLQKLIEQYGLYEFIKMTGLDFNQVKSIINKMDNPKEILKQYIREFVLEHGGSTSEAIGSLFALQIPLSDIKIVQDILVQDSSQIAVEIWGYDIDEYGYREQNEQYLTTINSLSNEELLSIISWMMETIEEGYWY